MASLVHKINFDEAKDIYYQRFTSSYEGYSKFFGAGITDVRQGIKTKKTYEKWMREGKGLIIFEKNYEKFLFDDNYVYEYINNAEEGKNRSDKGEEIHEKITKEKRKEKAKVNLQLEEVLEVKKEEEVVEVKGEEEVVEVKGEDDSEEIAKDIINEVIDEVDKKADNTENKYECERCCAVIGGEGDYGCKSLKEFAGEKFICDVCLLETCTADLFKEIYDMNYNIDNIINKKVNAKLTQLGISIIPNTEKNKERKKEVLKESKKNKSGHLKKVGAKSKNHNPNKSNKDDYNPLCCKARVWNDWYGGQCSCQKIYKDELCKMHYNKLINIPGEYPQWYYGFMTEEAECDYPAILDSHLPKCVRAMRNDWGWHPYR
jgi:hypothetical protein